MTRTPHPCHVVVHADRDAVPDAAFQGLTVAGCTVSRTEGDEALLETLVRESPAALVVGLRDDHAADVALLTLVRRVGPNVPLILVGGDDSLGQRQALQRFQPHYYALAPCESDELVAAVLVQTRRRRSAGA